MSTIAIHLNAGQYPDMAVQIPSPYIVDLGTEAVSQEYEYRLFSPSDQMFQRIHIPVLSQAMRGICSIASRSSQRNEIPPHCTTTIKVGILLREEEFRLRICLPKRGQEYGDVRFLLCRPSSLSHRLATFAGSGIPAQRIPHGTKS